MGRYVGSSINKGTGGGGGGSILSEEFDAATGITTNVFNQVTRLETGGALYENIHYSNVGLITAFEETIGGSKQGFNVAYGNTETNLVESIVEVGYVEPVPTYNISAPTSSVDEGNSIVFTLQTTNVPDGETLYWNIVHGTTEAADFYGATDGSFQVAAASGTVSVATTALGNTEGDETFSIGLYSDNAFTTLVGSSPAITINDTSTGPPTSTPIYDNDGESSWITNNNDTWNSVKVYRSYSNQFSFNASETPTEDDWGPWVSDGTNKWYIGINFGGSAVPSRWGQKHGIYTYQKAQSPGGGYNFTFGTAATGGPHTTHFSNVRGSSTQQSGTTAGIVTTNYNDLEYVATEWTNSYGDGFASFYSDSNSSNHKYPDIINALTSHSPEWNPDGHGQGDSDGGMILWRPPKPAQEVMLVYANNHSNNPCNITCWDNINGQVKWQARYGRPSGFSIGGSVVNENYTRTIVAQHSDGLVYFNSDHSGTVAGAFYYMYR